MAKLSEADRYLLEQIRKADPEGWSQLVSRYQGRLLAFAQGRLKRKADAEDLVQDTFAAFLQSVRTFRDECSLETFLFTILRRKIIDVHRGRELPTCFIGAGRDEDEVSPYADQVARDQTASWYLRQAEQASALEMSLASALNHLTDRLRDAENFRDLKILEMLFYAQLRNKEIASLAGIDEKHIALIKHRAIKDLREQMPSSLSQEIPQAADSLLTQVWERQRPTCLKRSTIGRFLLGTLEPPWQEYVDFHLNRLGCRFCRANLDDLQQQNAQEPVALRQRIFQSTVGFLSHSG